MGGGSSVGTMVQNVIREIGRSGNAITAGVDEESNRSRHKEISIGI
jgi:hypothetical protein